MQRISLTIDGQDICVPTGTTILSAARRLNISIPTLCHFPGQTVRAVCRICVVELEGTGHLVPACAAPAQDGMKIATDSAAVVAARRVLMEFILAEHGECDNPLCGIEQLAEQIGVSTTRFQATRRAARSDLSSDFVSVQPQLCVHCDRCIQACQRDQQVLARTGRGANVAVAFDDGRSMGESSCTGCGDCVTVCPAGGLLEAV
ncbi:MAG: 2Fe-2S iron-sulfur cluster-binding protein [Pirellulaceae bacterium]|nr:2Fe-2S iron-sulfur cluster-binding protein [Pirellulaceae bacterium]